MRDLTLLEKQGHYSDRSKAESLLAGERGLRNSAEKQIGAVQTDAAHWIDRAQHLPAEAQSMERSYQAIHAFDLSSLKAAVGRAETDWPEKKNDLDTRLAS